MPDWRLSRSPWSTRSRKQLSYRVPVWRGGPERGGREWRGHERHVGVMLVVLMLVTYVPGFSLALQ